MIRRVEVPGRPRSESHSAAVVVNGLCFASGQVPIDERGELVDGPIEDQTRVALENVERVLTAAGSGLDRLVSVVAILVDIDDRAGFDRAYRSYLTGVELPARLAYAADALPFGARVELQVVAEAPG